MMQTLLLLLVLAAILVLAMRYDKWRLATAMSTVQAQIEAAGGHSVKFFFKLGMRDVQQYACTFVDADSVGQRHMVQFQMQGFSQEVEIVWLSETPAILQRGAKSFSQSKAQLVDALSAEIARLQAELNKRDRVESSRF